jgi:hypothetical protein
LGIIKGILYLGRNLEGLIVAAVLLRLLSHEANIGDVASRLPVELTVLPGGHRKFTLSFTSNKKKKNR